MKEVVMLRIRIIKMLPWWVYLRKKSKAGNKVISRSGGRESGGWGILKQACTNICKHVPPPPHTAVRNVPLLQHFTVRLTLLQGPSVVNRQAN